MIQWDMVEHSTQTTLNIINVDLFIFAELECAFTILLGEVVGFVDFGGLGKFTVSFHCR